MVSTFPKFVSILALVVSSSCAFKSIDIRKERVSDFKRAAIIGYDGLVNVREPPRNRVTAMVSAFKSATDQAWDTRRLDQGDAAYRQLSDALSSGMGWTMLSRDELERSPSLAYRLDHRFVQFGRNEQRVRRMLTQAAVNGLGPERLAAIAKELDVDTLVSVSVTFEPAGRSGLTIGGMGSSTTYPSARVQFRAFDRTGELVWVDHMAIGAPASTGLRTTMGAAVVEGETDALTQAAASAFAAVVERYRTYVPQVARR